MPHATPHDDKKSKAIELDNSRPFDVHTWSNHPEINTVVDSLWVRMGYEGADDSGGKKRGPKPKTPPKDQFKVLLLDLYVAWRDDPTMYLAIHMSKSGWKTNSRYNALHLSSEIIDYVKALESLEMLLRHPGYIGKLTRIRATPQLAYIFTHLAVSNSDIERHKDQEIVILRSGAHDALDGDGEMTKAGNKADIDYIDTDETHRMRGILRKYNLLLSQSYIDVCSLEHPYTIREQKVGKPKRSKIKIHIDGDNVFVRRIFNNESWTQGGRFYGGWWQHIEKEYRSDIVINDMPTIEIDFKAMHIAILYAKLGKKAVFDPYRVEAGLPDLLISVEEKRDLIKQLVLMSLNASTRIAAYKAFRGNQEAKHPFGRLKDAQLEQALDAFLKENEVLRPYLCTGKGLELMYEDSKIAEAVIEHFTNEGIPVLCMHDSFIIQYDKTLELRAQMVGAAGVEWKRYFFTDKKDVGLDEWIHQAINDGKLPPKAAKEIVRCKGYIERLAKVGIKPQRSRKGFMERRNTT